MVVTVTAQKRQESAGWIEQTGTYSWLITVIACALLAYVAVWKRGFYSDDYTFATGQLSTFPTRPLGEILRVLLITPSWSQYEFLVVFLDALFICVNALLLGYLVYRLSRSRLAALTSVWLFLIPAFSNEALLWASAYLAYVPAAFFTLLFWNLYYSALKNPRYALRFWGGAIAAFVVAVLFLEAYTVGAVAFLPFVTVILVIDKSTSLKRAARFLSGTTLTAVAILLVVYILLYVNSANMQGQLVAARGNVDLNLVHLFARTEDYARRLYWLTLSPQWGARLYAESFQLGMQVIQTNLIATVLFIISVLSSVVSALTINTGDPVNQPRYSSMFILLIGGIAVGGLSLLLPGILLGSQQLESRMLYFPAAGLAIAAASLLALVQMRLRTSLVGRAGLLLCAGFLIFNSVSTLGDAKAYSLRFESDQKSISSLSDVLSSADINQPVFLIPYRIDRFLPTVGSHLNRKLLSAFEVSWALQSIVDPVADNDVRVITSNHWAPLQLEPNTSEAGELIVNQQSIPLAEIVLFTINDEQVFLIRSLTFGETDGGQTVRFPIIEAFPNDDVILDNIVHDS